MNSAETAWLSGYLEGEGCFRMSVSPHRPNALGTPSVKVASVDRDVMERAAKLMGVECRESSRKTVSGKRVFAAEACGEKAITVMRAILPHMGERRGDKIRDVLRLAASRTGAPRGDQRTDIKLRNADVVEIRRLFHSKVKQVDIARKYNVSQALISLVIADKRRGTTVTTVNTLTPTNVDGT